MGSTPVGSNALILEVLDRSNYRHWRSRLKTYLLAEDLWEAVEAIVEPPKLEDDQADYKAWTKKNAKALYAIQNSCGRELFSFISEIETAKSAWEALEQECKVVQEVLNCNNYGIWRSRMETYLLSKHLWEVVKARQPAKIEDNEAKYKKWTKKNAKALYAIQNSCGHEMFSFISEIETAKVAWEALERVSKVKGNNQYSAKDFKRYIPFTNYVTVGDWNNAKECLKELPEAVTITDPRNGNGDTALHVAAKKGYTHIVKELVMVMTPEDLQAKNCRGFTALLEAVLCGNLNTFKEIVAVVRQEALGVKTIEGSNALHLAVKTGHVDIVKELVLLMTQEDLQAKNCHGCTALHEAVLCGNVDTVKELLTAVRQEALGLKTTEGSNALHLAVKNGHVDIVKELVQLMSKEDLEMKNDAGLTALQEALKMGNVPIVIALVPTSTGEKYADDFDRYLEFTDYVNDGDWDKLKVWLTKPDDLFNTVTAVDPRDECGDTVLHLAVKNGHVHIVKNLVSMLKVRLEDLELKTAEDFIAFGSVLYLNVSQGALMERVKYMIEHYEKMLICFLEVQNAKGFTALHLAVLNGNVDIVKELMTIMRKEGLEIKEVNGETALHKAVINENVDIVKELATFMRQEGLEIQDSYRGTALHIAVKKENVDIVKELVTLMREKGLEIKGKYGNTALQYAVGKENVDIVKELVTSMRAEGLEIIEDYGKTALHIAVEKKNVDIVKELVTLMREESLEIKEANGQTALCSAVFIENVDIVKELATFMRQEGLEIKCPFGATALHIAVVRENVGIVKELVTFMREEGLEIKDDYGNTALHFAVNMENVEIVKELVRSMRQEGLEIEATDGETALHIAVKKENVDIVRELVKSMRQKGLEIRDANGDTALHIAAEKKNVDIMKVLVPLMSEEALEEKNDSGFTALGLILLETLGGEANKMAMYMVQRNSKILGIGAPPLNMIPVAAAFNRNSNWELSRYLYSVTQFEALMPENGPHGATLLSVCLVEKELGIALELIHRCPDLAFTTDHFGSSPIYYLAGMRSAFLSGTRLTLWQKWIYNGTFIQLSDYLFHEISINIAREEDVQDNQRDLAHLVKSLFQRTIERVTKLLGINHIHGMKLIHVQILEILRCICEVAYERNSTNEPDNIVSRSMFQAVEKGHVEFVSHMGKANPDLKTMVNEKGMTIFCFAVQCRQEKIYNLIYKLRPEDRKTIAVYCDTFLNNMLHMVGNLSPMTQFSHIQSPALQMQREIQWFEAVKTILPPHMHEFRGSSKEVKDIDQVNIFTNYDDGMTPWELFTKNHKILMEEAEKSMKGIASSCTVVGALIVTMMFAAAFTIPGGNNGNTGVPMFMDENLFLVFIVSDTASLIFSTTSVIIFLGIVTSRYAEKDFLKSLPTKMIIGLSSLFLSIVAMMVAFSSGLVMMLHEKYSWIVAPIILVATVPVMSFVWMLFPFLAEIFISTYGPGIFDKKVKPWSTEE